MQQQQQPPKPDSTVSAAPMQGARPTSYGTGGEIDDRGGGGNYDDDDGDDDDDDDDEKSFRGAVVAHWLRLQTLNYEVPGSNLLAVARHFILTA